MKDWIEKLAEASAVVYFCLGVVLFYAHFEPTFAAVDTTFPSNPGVVDPIARSQIEHVKELIQAADKRYEQRFNAQEGAVAAALLAQEKAIAAALSAAKEAVTKAEVASEKRLDSVNEFRGQLKDQAGTFVTRAELLAAVTTTLMVGIALIGLFQKWLRPTPPQPKKEES